MPLNRPSLLLEVAVEGYEAAMLAAQAGADRIELNSGLALGGLTPSMGMLRRVMEDCPIPVIPMLRPRGAGFCYSQAEMEELLLDLELLLAFDIAGVAFGFLTEDCQIDMARSKRVVDRLHAAGKLAIVHRAFDNTQNMHAAAEALIALGVDRVLTSGQAVHAGAGIAALADLQRQYGQDLEILPACGVRPENARAILEGTGCFQLHSSCKVYAQDKTTVNKVSYALPGVPEPLAYPTVSLASVRAMRKAMDA